MLCEFVLTDWLRCGRSGRWEVLGEVDVAHVAATAAEVVRPILHLWGQVGYDTAVILAPLIVSQVRPTT